MFFFKQNHGLRSYLQHPDRQDLKIGFVPTMGALHEGHLSLIRQSLAEQSLTVCSIFVNPTQFNEAADLQKYPRTPEKDVEKLLKVGCDVLFFPVAAEIYPDPPIPAPNVDLQGLDRQMEGAHRPGHFAGVVQVVHRLLTIVEPQAIYMGQKDFQQFTIIGHMLRELDMNVDLRVCPIFRDPDGLAMSSRNVRLTPEFREKAPVLYQSLLRARTDRHTLSPLQLSERALQQIRQGGLEPEYFSIIDGNTLEPLDILLPDQYAVACVAARAGEVRLIDNMILQQA